MEKRAQGHMFRNYPDVMDIRDLQRALGIGKSTAYALVESNRIPNFKIGRIYKISKSALIDFIQSQSGEQAKPL